MNRPSIYEFTDLALFLKSFFEYLRKEQPDFTIRRWAVQMGLSSPKPLVAVLQNTRELRMKDLEFLLKGLDLNSSETRFLELLLLIRKAKDPREKASLYFLLGALKKADRSSTVDSRTINRTQTTYEIEDDELFSHWLDAALISALQLKSARANLDLFRENLLWQTDTRQLDQSLEKLKKLGLLDTGQGNAPKYDSITTRSDRHHKGAKTYFEQVNRLATEAIELPLREREFQCFSIPASVAETPQFKQMIRNFREEISGFSSEDGDIVYQFNIEMFPLTKPITAKPNIETEMGQKRV